MSSDTAGFPVTLLITLLALVFVLVLAWLAIKLLARSGAVAMTGRNGRLRLVQSVPVGARERIVLLEVDGEEWVVGVSAGSVTRLDRGALRGDGESASQNAHSTGKV